MKKILKRTLAMLLCLTMILGMGLVSGVISAPVASASEETQVGATRTVKKSTDANGAETSEKSTGILSYADLVATYGTATGADGLTDGFLYVGTEYYEADGRLTDGYIKPGDKLTVKVYVKSNMYTGDGYIISLYDNSIWDVKIVADGASTDANGYTSNFTGKSNSAHPATTTNGYTTKVTSINITNAGWIKNTCGFDTDYLAATDLVQTQTSTNTSVSSLPYQFTSDEWLMTYYVTLKSDLPAGTTEVSVKSPDVIWQSYLNGAKHDARKRAYVPVAHLTATGINSTSNCKTMCSQLDSGALDYFIKELEHTFIIGEPAAPEVPKKVIFRVDGEIYGEVKEYAEGETIVVPEDPTKEGYTFAGWDSTPGVMGTEDLVFNATWVVNSYNVTWDVDGETTEETYEFGAAIVAPADPEKEGHTFAGWNPAVPDTMPADNAVFTATWDVNTYDVTWDIDGVTTTDSVEYGAEINAPADPEKEGYTFAGWDIEIPDTMPAEDLTFTATWEVNSYNVTWDVDGETTEETYEFGAAIVAPADPEKEGHTFAGWNPAVPDTMPADNAVFTATWDVNTYDVTWDIDGVITTDSVEYGAEINAPADPEKEGYTFAGWDIEIPDAMPAADLTFTATWEVNSYNVTWDVDGETTVTPVEYGEEIVVPEEPVKEGYTFIGWTPSIPDSMPAEDLEFTAIWEVNEYTVTWDVDGETTEEIYEYGDPVSIPTPPEKEGYTFAGWDPEIPDTMPAKNITLTAKWDKIIIFSIITLDANGGKFSNGAPVYPVSAEVGVPFNEVPQDPTRDGYTFIGWTDEDGNATSIPKYFPAEDVTIKAKWAEGEGTVYTVATYTMDVNGEYGDAEVAYYATEEATVVLAPEAAEGFSVAEESKLEAEVAADGSTVLEVYLSRNKYSVTFAANGGSFDGEETVAIDVYYGAAIEEPAAPVKDEYNFNGWDAEIPESMPVEDLTFTANWVLAHTHETVLITEDATCTENGKKYYYCDGCGETVGNVEIIPAKGHVAGEWIVETEATTESEGTAVKKCTVCGETVETATLDKLPAEAPVITTADGEEFVAGSEITYGESVVLTVDNIPEDATVEWIVEGEGIEITVSEDGKTCTVKSVSSGKATVKAIVTDANENETVAETEIVSDACFFQKLVYFFKTLFNSIFALLF